MNMEIPDIEGLDNLNQAIIEALEIEKCSICLEKLENTVLLWPCTHWFCKKCISTLHKSAKGEKVTCPLCKSATSRRKVLPFHDKQREYEDHLQTLIGALSLDLKFDVTSYDNVRKQKVSTGDETRIINEEVVSLPVKKTRRKASVRVIEVKNKADENKIRQTKQLGKLQENNINSVANNNTKTVTSALPTIAMLPETPDSPKQKKVVEWLDSNKFSQADQDICVDTVVADVHKAEQDESLCFSETALQSVSQMDIANIHTPIRPIPIQNKKLTDTPSDVNAIRVIKMSKNKLLTTKDNVNRYKKAISMPSVETFDEIFPDNRKLQDVKTTYGSKNPYACTRTRGQRFAVQVDLFKSIDESKNDIGKSSLEETNNSSEGSLEDFSSGSGEEWAVERKTRKNNPLSKGKTMKNNMKKKRERKLKNPIDKYISAKAQRNRLRDSNKGDVKEQKVGRNVLQNQNNNKDDKSETLFKCVAGEEFSKPKDLVKGIIDDWNDTKDSNTLLLDKSQTLIKQFANAGVSGPKNIKPVTTVKKIPELKEPSHLDGVDNETMKTPFKEVNVRSPGWSRLESTKKEFHLSEKKKLSLKTVNTSKSTSSLTNIGISPLVNQSKSSISSLSKTSLERTLDKSGISVDLDKTDNSSKNNINETSCNKIVNAQCDMKTPEMCKNLNTSLTSSASGSPFRGFVTPEEPEPLKKSIMSLNNKSLKPNNTDPLRLPPSNMQDTDVTNKNIEVHTSNSVTKGDPMEIVLMPPKDSTLPQLKYNENIMFASKMYEEGSLEKFNTLENNNGRALVEECLIFPKKRDRDSGIHNESGISSPVRKKICRDAEVQTSPSRMQSVIRDMLKDMCGIELEDMINKSNKLDSLKKTDSVATSPNHCFITNSQDSDKENVNLSSNNPTVSKKFSDNSDIVFGTEDCLALTKNNPLQSSTLQGGLNHRNQDSSHLKGLKGMEVFNDDDIDPDAPTQLYKTPVALKKPLKTSTKDLTVISNPTSSELKRVDYLFDKSDVLFPDETPKGTTPWNYSGVDQLNGKTGTMKKCADENTLSASQSSKEKSTRSRRQLDFVEDNSNDLFEFERQTSDELKGDVTNHDFNNSLQSEKERISSNKIDEIDDIFIPSNEILDRLINSPVTDKIVSASYKNEFIAIKPKEMNFQNEIESDNMTDTTGIVGPSEVQCVGERVSLCNKQGYNADLDINVASSNPEMCSATSNVKNTNNYLQSKTEVENDPLNAQQDSSFMFQESSHERIVTNDGCVNAREDDEESNHASDVSYVDGTPDISQNEGYQQEIQDDENNLETNDQPQDIVATDVPTVTEAGSNTFEHDRVLKSIDQSVFNESQQKDKEKADIVESRSNQTIDNTEVEDENLCFASSLLNAQQNQVLACVLGAMGLTYSKSVGPHISHLIVGTKNKCFQNTYKVLLAMALHKPIIRFDWVEEVIRTGGTVPLDPFVALDPSGECGVLRAKADRNRQLLLDFAIHIYNVNDRIVLKEQIEELVRLCGGTVVKELHDFNNVPRDKFRVIVLSEPPDSLTQGDWRHKYSAVEVMIDWVYNTIGRYRVMPLVPFMVTEATDAVPFLQHEGYPKELIFDLSIQE